MHLFYPDWVTDEGCANDGNEPGYMSVNAGDYLYSTLDKCCNTYFNWMYDKCMGRVRGPCARALFYPDWSGTNEGCIADGNEPKYMTSNHKHYLYVTIEECCHEHYDWDYIACTGKVNKRNNRLYYPDWLGSPQGCGTGGGQPKYMNAAPEWWLYETLEQCCKTNFEWFLADCLGDEAPTAPSPSSPSAPGMTYRWYPDWLNGNEICKNDGQEPGYMSSGQGFLHDTQKSCCNQNFSWHMDKCMSYGGIPYPSSLATPPTAGRRTPRPTPRPAGPTAPVPGETGSGKYWYDSWITKTCVRDCIHGYSDCGGHKPNWGDYFDTYKSCCEDRLWWSKNCRG